MELNYAQVAAKGFPQPIQRVYLLHGTDDALKREALRRLTEPLLDPSFADFDREEREIAPSGAGDETAAAQILASAGGAPMASERRVVIVQGVQRLGREDQEALAAGLEKLGPLSCLALVAGAPEYEAGKVKGKTIGAKLVNAVAKHGATVLCDAPGEGDLKARAAALLKSRGKSIAPEAWALLLKHAAAVAADRGGGAKTGDVTALLNELEKMMAYAGDRAQVTAEDARAVGLRDAQENVFALCDAVGRRDARRALAEADELLGAGDKPDAVAARTFVMLARHLRMLWGAKFLAEKRVGGQNARALPPDVQALLSGEMLGLTQRQSYRLRDLQEQARDWDYRALGRALGRVLASDLTMKGMAVDDVLGVKAPPLADDAASNLRLLAVELCREGIP
ncbi:MAG: DNA polymerase III subunit delta [Armatimonadetes bacterium]|nr:DNA polymerase III subunit delta [Armatimonadota bacterium]